MQLISRHNFSSVLTKPILSAFAHLGHRRVLHYKSGSVKLDIPVISVGNITFGGTSKTPVAEYIARNLFDKKRKPGIVLRGYRGRIDRENLPPEIVSDGIKLLLDWRDAGDEACLIAENFLRDNLNMPVAVGRNRASASDLLIEKCGVDVILLDDGYQYSRLDRDLDIVLIDAIAPFGSSTLDSGILREPLNSLDRADIVLITHTEAVDDSRLHSVREIVTEHTRGDVPIHNACTIVINLRDFLTGAEIDSSVLKNMTYIGFAGVGNHKSFEFTVENLPGKCAGVMKFPDHHLYSTGDLRKISQLVKRTGAGIVLTTAKDAVRLRDHVSRIQFNLAVVEIDVEIDRGDVFFRSVHDAVTDNH